MQRDRIDVWIAAASIADRVITRLITIVMILAAVAVLAAAWDAARFTAAGMQIVEYHDFAELQRINPDTVAWITMDGTRIDHPVVRGEDNFEYLDKDFYGNDYAGGCIFLDEQCDPALTGAYLIIHGHHMAHGAMFGDLSGYLESDFFEEHSSGRLLTADGVYELTVVGAATVDAYDTEVYYTSEDRPLPMNLLDRSSLRRDVAFAEGDRLLLLSTCSGDMSNNRTAVFCRMRYAGENQ